MPHRSRLAGNAGHLGTIQVMYFFFVSTKQGTKEKWYVQIVCHIRWDDVQLTWWLCVILHLTGASTWVAPVWHRRHVASHLEWEGDSNSSSVTHKQTTLLAELRQESGTCVCAAMCGIALAIYNIRQQVKSYLIELKSPEVGPPCHVALFLPFGTEQDEMAQLNSHFTLSYPAVARWIPLRHRRSVNTTAARIYCSEKLTLQYELRCLPSKY